MKKRTGFTLISIMVGIATSSIILLMIGQLSSLSRRNLDQTRNLINLYSNARIAMSILTKYIRMGGYGLNQPVPRTVPYSSAIWAGPSYAGNSAIIRNWVYIGLYQNFHNPTGSVYYWDITALSAGSANVPDECGRRVGKNYESRQFFGLSNYNRCYFTYDERSPSLIATTAWNTYAAGYGDLACCGTSVGVCSSPMYQCGIVNGYKSYPMTVYQKMNPVVYVTPNGAQGDRLTVIYRNPGPNYLHTLNDNWVQPDFNPTPTRFQKYSFYVKTGTTDLEILEESNGSDYTKVIAENVEYFKVSVGVVEFWETRTVSGTTEATLPGVTRYAYLDSTKDYYTVTTSSILPYYINAVKFAFVMRTPTGVLTTAPTFIPKLKLFAKNSGATWEEYPTSNVTGDTRVRKAFMNTVYLNYYQVPYYQPQCVKYYNTTTYYLKRSGVPFADMYTGASYPYTSDSSCTSSATFSGCETERRKGNCAFYPS